MHPPRCGTPWGVIRNTFHSYATGLAWDFVEFRHPTDGHEQNAPNADAVMHRRKRMSQFVQHHAGEKRQQGRRVPKQTGHSCISPARERIYGQQQEEGKVHCELNAAHPERFIDQPSM